MADADRRVSRLASGALPAHIDTVKHSPPLRRDNAQQQVDPGARPSLPVEGDLSLYTYAEAARFLRISQSTLRLMIGRGEIPAELTTRTGGRVWMTGQQIRQAIRHCQNAPAAPAPDPVRRRKRVAA